MPDNSLFQFQQALSKILQPEAIITNKSKCYAYGTDASFYRLVPEIVLILDNLEQVVKVLQLANRYLVAITFRAAGTSMSGQAVTDSVLLTLSDKWTSHQIHENGELITLQPGIIGAKANLLLKPYGRKLGPDPASINSCKIGGIAANNSSGMCCGVKHNSYHTVKDMTLILANGDKLNTASRVSCNEFIDNNRNLVDELIELSLTVKNNPILKQKIQYKYRLKNTTGYGINALIDFNDPIEIIKHLMIGSEGTLGFIADITYHAITEYQHKASGFYIFKDMQTACLLVDKLSQCDVSAVELLDKRALLSVAEHHLMPDNIADLPEQIAALLIEVHAPSLTILSQYIAQIENEIIEYQSELLINIALDTDVQRNEALWNIRKGMLPAVGAMREPGTTLIVEDVAVPINQLSASIQGLHRLFDKYAYDDAIIFGHALDGNLHFVFSQSFQSEEDTQNYDQFMLDLGELVAVELQGSLKSEHGTGRNMAPFVALEWGHDAYKVMKKIKHIFDPGNILNPGVVINQDSKIHIKNLKQMPKADEYIDKCIECGFCESVCPSNGLSFTPRQRISIWRRITQIKQLIEDSNSDISQTEKLQLKKEYDILLSDYQYLGIDTCAATGLCGMKCPVGINTGDFIKALRTDKFEQHNLTKKLTNVSAKHFTATAKVASLGFAFVNKAKNILGDNTLNKGFNVLNKISNNTIPIYFSNWPKAEKKITGGLYKSQHTHAENKTLIYLPACVNRVFAAETTSDDQRPLYQVVISVLNKAGFDVLIPQNPNNLCCGMPYASKGDTQNSNEKSAQLTELLYQLSEQGTHPVMMDASPCSLTLNNSQKKLTVYESAEFIDLFVINQLKIKPVAEKVMLHVTCSTQRKKLEQHLINVTRRCAEKVIIPADIQCCGFAGDKGFYQPELNEHALKSLRQQIPKGCNIGISNSRSCEIGLTRHSGVPYQSLFYLVDSVSFPIINHREKE